VAGSVNSFYFGPWPDGQYDGDDYFQMLMYDLAKSFSDNSRYTIVDSSSGSGDPITSSAWTRYANPTPPPDYLTSVPSSNAWFVVEATNASTIWHAKFQSVNRLETDTFDDPSGNDYGHEGEDGLICLRVGTGGWSTSSNDFVTPSKASDNREVQLNQNWRNDYLLTMDDDTVVLMTRHTPGEATWYGTGTVNQIITFGGYIPKSSSQTEPVMCITPDAGSAMNPRLGHSAAVNTPLAPTGESNDARLGLIESTGSWAQRYYRARVDWESSLSLVTHDRGAATAFGDGGIYLVPITLCVSESNPSEYDVGELNLIKGCGGAGTTRLFGGGRWLSTSWEPCVAVRWDGSTTVRPLEDENP